MKNRNRASRKVKQPAPQSPIDLYSYICSACAQQLGGKWPRGHVATMHTGICEHCGKLTCLANVGDWNWPDNIRRGMRD